MGSGEERVTLGKSIVVPSVQELAQTSLTTVPDRYIQYDQDPPILLADDDGGSSNVQVPIINMEKLLFSPDEEELQRLHLACQEWGFFQLINHGVNPLLLEKFKLETQEFLNLPTEEKRKYWQTPTDLEGFGQLFVKSEEQKLDWADMFYLTTLPTHQRKSNLLPMLPLPYRDTLESYSMEMRNLALKILDCMAKVLNVDTEVVKAMIGEGKQTMRMNYYPPCPQPDKVIGLSPHSDATVMITILLELNEIEGLQIIKDGKWLLIKPAPDAFVINIGDILEIMTNGIYRSVEHRALVNATKERMSVATFYTAGNDQEIGPIPSLITPKNPKVFRNVKMVDYWKGFFARALNGKSYLELMRIKEKDDGEE